MTGDPSKPLSRANSRRCPRILALVFVMIAGSAMAQGVQLTAQQQGMLNQLPPAQREAALQQIRNLQASQRISGSASSAQPTTIISAPQPMPEEPPGPPVFVPGDTVVLGLQVRTADARRDQIDGLEELRKRILGENPFRLDPLGRLVLSGVGEIGLAGLTEEQAMLRLGAEPEFANIAVKVTRLPLQAVGVDALKPFGYELFQRDSQLLSANTSVPVAADYVVGAGDTVRVQMFGNQNAEYELPVDRNGTIHFPDIGPLTVSGLTYVGMQELIDRRVREQLIGTQVSVTLGEMRALQVFVVGDVNSPGSYAVAPMSTITTALAQSGGVAEQGSLRRVQLRRDGQLVQTLDVYDLLLRGDTRGDLRLRAGDVVFVPPVGTRVTVAGEVNRPANYEYLGAANIADVIALAGGLRPTAYQAGVKIERFSPGSGLRIIEADQDGDTGPTIKISDGDTVIVPAGVVQLEDSIVLAGNVQRPGEYQWRSGLRISQLIRSSRDLKEGSDLNYLLIRRELVPNAELAVLSADVEAAWAAPGGAADLVLQPRDTIYVFDLSVGRAHVLDPLIAELRLRTSRAQPLAVARVGGSVNADGRYPIEAGMRIADLVRAAGGAAEDAYLTDAEVTRYKVVNGEERKIDLIRVDLRRALQGDPQANILLQPFDYLHVKRIPHWREQAFVEIRGEVAFPGRFPIKQGESLKSVIDRAGGLSELAFPQGSIFTRDSLKQREREQLEVLADRIESDLATMSLSDPSQSEAVSVGQSLLNQLRSTKPVGRLVVNLRDVIAGRDDDVILRDGDVLLVPVVAQEVTVLGEVQYATSHIHDPTLSRDDYIDKSGGVTRKADKKNAYVVRASGDVVVRQRSRFFSRPDDFDIEPGDTIVVPLHTDRINPITFWTGVTQVLYNLAIATAAVNSFR